MIPYAEQTDDEFDEIEKKVAWYHKVLLNGPFKVFLVLLLLGVIAPALVYRFVFYESLDLPPADGLSMGSCLLPRESRIPCGLGSVQASQCHPQCCYDLANNHCFHRLPSRFSYLLDNDTWNEEDIFIPRIHTVPYGSRNSLPYIQLSFDEVSATHLTITLYDPKEKSLNGRRLQEKEYNYRISTPELNIEVTANNRTIFTTARGPIIAANDIWEMSFQLTNETMYGLGEIPLQDTPKVLYNRKGDVNSIPLIYAVSNGSYHGLLIDITTPTEILKKDNLLVIRSITKSGLKFHLFVGPTPRAVMNDVRSVIGSRELEYWMLGAHICNEIPDVPSEMYGNLTQFVQQAASDGLPFESHCGTTPIVFDSSCEVVTSLMPEAARFLSDNRKRFIPQLSPHVLYKEVINESEEIDIYDNETRNEIDTENCTTVLDFGNILLNEPNTSQAYIGLVNNHTVIYPNYENVTDEFIDYLWSYDITVDGLIFENNWPLDETPKDHNYSRQSLPYFSEEFENAFNYTPGWNVTITNETYFYRHNEYGNNFVEAFAKISNGTPTWSTSGILNGNVVVNTQNVETSWTNLHQELVKAALGGVSGQWLWSSPICGDTKNFNDTQQVQLCLNWYLAAAYLPMINIHSKSVRRDPLSFSGTTKNYMLNALSKRQTLLPYFYTTLQHGPLLRPMFFQYPDSKDLLNLTSQFNVGDNLLIVPMLLPNQINVHFTMPPGRWYELWSGLHIVAEEGDIVTMGITEGEILTMIRGGSVLITQKNIRVSAEDTRLNSDLTIIVALDCYNNTESEDRSDKICKANGTLYMTSNMTLSFETDSNHFTIKAVGDEYESFCGGDSIWTNKINDLSIYGLEDVYNNYDHSKHVQVNIDLCELVDKDEIVYDLFI